MLNCFSSFPQWNLKHGWTPHGLEFKSRMSSDRNPTAARAAAAVSLSATAANSDPSRRSSVPLSNCKPANKENLVLTQEQHAHKNSANKEVNKFLYSQSKIKATTEPMFDIFNYKKIKPSSIMLLSRAKQANSLHHVLLVHYAHEQKAHGLTDYFKIIILPHSINIIL